MIGRLVLAERAYCAMLRDALSVAKGGDKDMIEGMVRDCNLRMFRLLMLAEQRHETIYA